MNAREMLLGGVAAIALGGGLLVAGPAQAQSNQGTNVSQSAVRNDAATFVTGLVGGRTTCTTSQDTVANLTVTITPNGNNFVYITGVEIQVASNVTGATSAVAWSSTNLAGTPTWLTQNVAGATTNVAPAMAQVTSVYPTGLKSAAAGVAVTIVPSATMASASQCPRVAWYQNPF